MSDRLFEGIGAPVAVARDDDAPPIDPTLDSCCQREVRFVMMYDEKNVASSRVCEPWRTLK